MAEAYRTAAAVVYKATAAARLADAQGKLDPSVEEMINKGMMAIRHGARDTTEKATLVDAVVVDPEQPLSAALESARIAANAGLLKKSK